VVRNPAIGKDASPFVFNPSDINWILAASGYWTAFIGGPHTDLPAVLGYRSRQLLVPLSLVDKEKARKVANLVYEARTAKQKRAAINVLNATHLAQADFEITDCAIGPGEPAIGVDWIRFNVAMTLPHDFAIADNLPASLVDCPAIPAEVMANLVNPHRHEHLLSDNTLGKQ
jgi:hypothetical protein